MSSSVLTSTSTAASPDGISPLSRRLDVIEKCLLLTFYGFFILPILHALWTRMDVGAGLLAISETLVLALVLIRKPARTLTDRPVDWLLALTATLAPTLIRPVETPTSWITAVAAGVIVFGICFQIIAKAKLGRRFGVVAANRGICCEGPYRLVRHPIYMGYLITHIAFLCSAFSWWNFLIYAITYSCMIPRIFAEERLLKRDPAYANYCERVRWRLLPGIL